MSRPCGSLGQIFRSTTFFDLSNQLTLVFCQNFFQAEDGIRDLVRSRGLGDVYKRQILGRVSHIDLNDSGINGRRLTDFTVGANWYWNQYTKFQFNWIHSRLNDVAIGDSEANAFAIRAQLDF